MNLGPQADWSCPMPPGEKVTWERSDRPQIDTPNTHDCQSELAHIQRFRPNIVEKLFVLIDLATTLQIYNGRAISTDHIYNLVKEFRNIKPRIHQR
ncbi:hypothetical protein T265_01834 [Opisthorchis viverrini]|uniref:Uncharacterized protein n=1 Tax=Opisthorchis viverrini TaxID=6198 RepID=A0A075A1C3_OPIVI|nr:hypothetical protein T265_01834 [Opisthorchis viverrini]KER32057.1 hypothetical protein T265_01834 [Opisthorchis viverrini]